MWAETQSLGQLQRLFDDPCGFETPMALDRDFGSPHLCIEE